jgi:hypothetical protein
MEKKTDFMNLLLSEYRNIILLTGISVSTLFLNINNKMFTTLISLLVTLVTFIISYSVITKFLNFTKIYKKSYKHFYLTIPTILFIHIIILYYGLYELYKLYNIYLDKI